MSTRAEEMLRQVWNNANANEEHKRMYERVTGRVKTFEECAFVIDQALPYDIVRELHLMPDEMAAVLNCWHNKMVAALDQFVQDLKAEAAETPTPAWILDR